MIGSKRVIPWPVPKDVQIDVHEEPDITFDGDVIKNKKIKQKIEHLKDRKIKEIEGAVDDFLYKKPAPVEIKAEDASIKKTLDKIDEKISINNEEEKKLIVQEEPEETYEFANVENDRKFIAGVYPENEYVLEEVVSKEEIDLFNELDKNHEGTTEIVELDVNDDFLDAIDEANSLNNKIQTTVIENKNAVEEEIANIKQATLNPEDVDLNFEEVLNQELNETPEIQPNEHIVFDKDEDEFNLLGEVENYTNIQKETTHIEEHPEEITTEDLLEEFTEEETSAEEITEEENIEEEEVQEPTYETGTEAGEEKTGEEELEENFDDIEDEIEPIITQEDNIAANFDAILNTEENAQKTQEEIVQTEEISEGDDFFTEEVEADNETSVNNLDEFLLDDTNDNEEENNTESEEQTEEEYIQEVTVTQTEDEALFEEEMTQSTKEETAESFEDEINELEEEFEAITENTLQETQSAIQVETSEDIEEEVLSEEFDLSAPIDENTRRYADDFIENIPVIMPDSKENEDTEAFEEGESVVHEKYGKGTILQIIEYSDKTLLQIDFEKVGKRLLDPRMANVKKAE